ncbi:hypothetical protein ACA910_001522 [Epithemia clementina (nom. ined.)]
MIFLRLYRDSLPPKVVCLTPWTPRRATVQALLLVMRKENNQKEANGASFGLYQDGAFSSPLEVVHLDLLGMVNGLC